MVKKVLVTGASGFLGQRLVEILISRGCWVVGVDTISSTFIDENYTFIQGSVADFELMKKLTVDVDEVYHLAARVPLAARDRDFLDSNVLSPGIVAKCCAINGVSSMLLVSSSAVYGLGRGYEYREEDQTLPFEPYGRSKLAGEESATRELGNNTKLVILRPRTILGPSRLGIFATLFDWVEKGINVPVFGNIGYGLQFIGVDDMVDAMIITQSKGVGTYNVGAVKYSSLSEVLKTLITTNDSSSKVVKFPLIFISALKLAYNLKLSPFTPWHVQGYAKCLTVNTDKLQALGWNPKNTTDSILIENYASFIKKEENGDSPHQKKIDTLFTKIISFLLK